MEKFCDFNIKVKGPKQLDLISKFCFDLGYKVIAINHEINLDTGMIKLLYISLSFNL